MAVRRGGGADRAAGCTLGAAAAREVEALEAALAQDGAGAGEAGADAREAVHSAEVEAGAAGQAGGRVRARAALGGAPLASPVCGDEVGVGAEEAAGGVAVEAEGVRQVRAGHAGPVGGQVVRVGCALEADRRGGALQAALHGPEAAEAAPRAEEVGGEAVLAGRAGLALDAGGEGVRAEEAEAGPRIQVVLVGAGEAG